MRTVVPTQTRQFIEANQQPPTSSIFRSKSLLSSCFPVSGKNTSQVVLKSGSEAWRTDMRETIRDSADSPPASTIRLRTTPAANTKTIQLNWVCAELVNDARTKYKTDVCVLRTYREQPIRQAQSDRRFCLQQGRLTRQTRESPVRNARVRQKPWNERRFAATCSSATKEPKAKQ